MSRLRSVIEHCRARGDKAAGFFLTNGFPDPESTDSVLEAVVEGGADFIELGMPFSDPLGEGVPIQRASERALRHGVRMRDIFRTAERFRARHDTPLLLMGYVNPVLRYGVEAFCRDARSAGVDGLILPDLPPEESSLASDAAASHGLDMVFLMAPNTSDDRVLEIDRKSTAFVYAVSITGLTGAGLGSVDRVADYLRRARTLVTQNPLLVGFGIRSREDAERLSAQTDGFIVGTALINLVERLWDETALPLDERLEEVRRFVSGLKHGERVEPSRTPARVG